MFFVVFYSFCVLIDLNKYEFRGKKVEPFGYEGALFDHKIGPFFYGSIASEEAIRNRFEQEVIHTIFVMYLKVFLKVLGVSLH